MSKKKRYLKSGSERDSLGLVSDREPYKNKRESKESHKSEIENFDGYITKGQNRED